MIRPTTTPHSLLARTLSATALGVVLAMAGAVPALAQSGDDATPAPTQLTVGLGFIPSVQFAQFYLAAEAGYYADAGLDVTFQNKIDPELITLVAQGAVDIGMADGTSIIPAVSQGIPIRYGATIYARFPGVVFALADSGIQDVEDLAGKRIGIPGRFGSSWIMLQALLASAGLAPEDVEVIAYPDFGQAVALAQGQVDAATGFANNEPVQLTLQGLDVIVLDVDEVAPLPGPGLAVGPATLREKGGAARAFTAATIRAMKEIAADPQKGLRATFAHVPELSSDPATQLAILEATIATWQSEYARANGMGSIDRDAWQSALDIMVALPDSVVASPVVVDDLITDELQP
jgi:NitT/TauT family transport system substrate-binding protein